MWSRYFILLLLEVSTSQSNPTIKIMVSDRIHDTSNVCTAMDVNDGPVSSSSGDSDISLETRPPPQVSDRSSSSDSPPPPPTKPARSADIPPDSASRPTKRARPYFDGASLELAQQEAILRWQLPRIPSTGH